MADGAIDKTAPTVQSDARSKGEKTRDRLLDLAYDAVIRKGFAATSIEELVEAAGITKSGFFYHFKDKNELARHMLDRYQAENDAFLASMAERARELSDDPLHSFLIFMKLYAEAMSQMVTTHPGCLVATITFQDQCFDREVMRMNAEGLLTWRAFFLDWLEEIAAVYPPRIEVDLTALADNSFAVTSGAITLSLLLRDNQAIARQALLYRDTVRMLFGRT
jgi:AcrR family transcriptional regulator